MKSAKQLERYLKGAANHRRIEIIRLVAKRDGIVLDDIASELACNLKTISEHTRRLVHAGLLNKHYQGREVAHTLSPYGRIMLKVFEIFSHS